MLRKRVAHVPSESIILRNIYVDLFTTGIVEVLSPEYSTVRRPRDVQRPSAAGDAVRDAKLFLPCLQRGNHSRKRSNQVSVRMDSKRMKPVPEQA